MEKDMKSPMETIIKPVISKLKLAGCHPEHFKFPAVLWWYYLFISSITVMILSFVHLKHLHKIDEICDIIVNIGSHTQIIFGLFFFRYYKGYFVEILDIMKTHFWFKPQDIDEKIIAKHTFFYRILSKIALIYQTVVFIAMFSWFTQPLFNSSRKFPMDMTFPYNNFIKETPYYEITYFLQFITICSCVFYSIVPSDILYIDTVGFSLIQVDLIRYRITRIISEKDTEKNVYKNLKKCIIHHNIILVSLEKIEIIYRNFMLNKLFCDIMALCCTGYLFSKEKNLNIKLIFILATTTIQPLLYCFFGDIVTSECESIGEEAYNIKWEDRNYKSLRAGLAMVIMRAQRQVLMTAGGMVILSLPNYLAFMKMMFSFYILMKRMDA